MAICLLAISACQNDSANNTNNSGAQLGNKVTQKMLFSGNTKYALLLDDAQVLGYYSVKQNSLASEYLTVYNSTIAEFDPSTKKVVETDVSKQVNFSVNGVHYRDLKFNSVQDDMNFGISKAPAQNDMFGKNVTFRYSKRSYGNQEGVQKAPSNEEIIMYVPELVQITSPNIEKIDEMLPYCYYKNFKLTWNADPNNTNGLFVAVEWSGADMFGKHYREVVRNADIIEFDNGEATLNNELFEGIPHGATVKLVLVRGNVEQITEFVNEKDEEEIYNIIGASMTMLPFILVREIGE